MERRQEAESIAEAYMRRLIDERYTSEDQALFMAIGAAMLEIEDVLAWLKIQFDAQLESGVIPEGEGRDTSMLPVHAIVLWRLYRSADDDDQVVSFCQSHFSKCLQWHNYFYQNQNPLNNGLISLDHETIDPFFNSVLGWSNQCLLELGYALELPSGDLFEQNEWTMHSLNELLWDEEKGIYHSFNLKSQQVLITDESKGFLPMLAGVPEINQAIAMVKAAFSDSYRQSGHYSIPSLSFDSADYDAKSQSKGGVSIAVNWLMVQSLKKYGFDDLVDIVREDTLKLINSFGLYTHFEPSKTVLANGHGTPDCPISALVYLDFSED